ncbi:MAG: hypothetical protein DI585_01330 [Pseudomonas fluorescens]|nr:MAG: hypothetical protein DI585_01330 [Pseudomonas fluorescens]
MAETAVIVRTRAALSERLSNWPGNNGDMTWGVVVCGGVPTAAELQSMRQAATLCDRIMCVRLFDRDRPVAPGFDELLRSAGVDIVWVPSEVDGPVKVDVGVEELGEAGTLLVQAITSVLPVLVVVPRGALSVVRACRNIQAGLGDLFSLRVAGE